MHDAELTVFEEDLALSLRGRRVGFRFCLAYLERGLHIDFAAFLQSAQIFVGPLMERKNSVKGRWRATAF